MTSKRPQRKIFDFRLSFGRLGHRQRSQTSKEACTFTNLVSNLADLSEVICVSVDHDGISVTVNHIKAHLKRTIKGTVCMIVLVLKLFLQHSFILQGGGGEPGEGEERAGIGGTRYGKREVQTPPPSSLMLNQAV